MKWKASPSMIKRTCYVLRTFQRRAVARPGCHVMSPSRCLDECDRSIPSRIEAPTPPPSGEPDEPTNADVSEAVLRAFLGAMIELFLGVSDPFNPDLLGAGFSAGARAGNISLASSRTRTAPSSLLNLVTISCSPYLSTKIARFGWTSQTVLRIRNRLSRTTARLCDSLSMIRLKKDDLASPIVSGLEMRQILRSGSSRFSNELALAETKHLSSTSSDSGLSSWSSILAVSSCSL